MKQSTLFGLYTLNTSGNVPLQKKLMVRKDDEHNESETSDISRNRISSIIGNESETQDVKTTTTTTKNCINGKCDKKPPKKALKRSLSLFKGKAKDSKTSLEEPVTETDTKDKSKDICKPVLESIAYEDFVKQASVGSDGNKAEERHTESSEEKFAGKFEPSVKHAKMKTDQIADKEEVTTDKDFDNSRKETMSYTDFLCLFKQPTPEVGEAVKENEEGDMGNVSQSGGITAKSSGCRSITSYFARNDCKLENVQASDSTTVTVTAEIHPNLSKKNQGGKLNTSLKPSPKTDRTTKVPTPDDDHNDIVVLSTETIFETEPQTNRNHLGVKKRKPEELPISLNAPKKQKTDSETKIILPQESKQKNLEKSNSVLEQEKGVPQSCEVSLPLAPPYVTQKTSQSTLCFTKSSLSLKKMEVKRAEPQRTKEEVIQENTHVTEKSGMDGFVTIRSDGKTERQTRRKGHLSSRSMVTNSKMDQQINIEATMIDTAFQSATTVVMPSQLEKTAVDENERPVDSHEAKGPDAETPSLRRSSRIAQSTQAVKEIDVVAIDSDEEDSSKSKENGKKSAKRGRSAKCSGTCESSKEQVHPKFGGKLAPIFNMGKVKDEVKALPTPPVDPEKERLRREFMMSGIPEELKRQIATAANIMATVNYPPFPSVSHIQHLPSDMDMSTRKISLKVNCLSDEEIHLLSSGVLDWWKLGWKKLEISSTNQLHLFEDFRSHGRLQNSQVDLLLRELQCADNKFPFRKTYNYLLSKMAATEDGADTCQGVENNIPSSSTTTVNDNEEIVIVDDASPVAQRVELKQPADSTACMWCDLHQPSCSGEIIGNKAAIKQLKEWLEEWKTVVQKEARKANRINTHAGKTKNRGGWSDDSDFTDSEDEDSRLCNTMLITGPHGVGKTAAVYALAQELGYKVFEVNASSLRSGKQLLGQLEEATQSHRVSQSKSKCALLESPVPGANNAPTDESPAIRATAKPPQTSKAQAFANLFKKGSASAAKEDGHTKKLSSATSVNSFTKTVLRNVQNQKQDTQSTKTTPKNLKESAVASVNVEELNTSKVSKNKRKRKDVESDNSEDHTVMEKKKSRVKKDSKVKKDDTSESDESKKNENNTASGSLNLTSVSLILIDEVDVVFEDDKGFLATVQHFMTSTKIPIILTTSESTFSMHLSARHDHLAFKRPPLTSITSFLCSVCLAHNVHVSHHSILNTVRYMKGDLRRSLLFLQYWCESGGGRVQVLKKRDLKPLHASKGSHVMDDSYDSKSLKGKKTARSASARIVSSDEGSENEFICIGLRSRTLKRIVCDDEEHDSDSKHSNISVTTDPLHSSIPHSGKGLSTSAVTMTGDDISEERKSLNKEVAKLLDDCIELPQHQACEESLLGLQGFEMSARTLLAYIKNSTLDLDEAVHVFHTINKALGTNALYHLALHCLPLPKIDVCSVSLAIPAPKEIDWPEAELLKKTKRKRIIQGDWLDSDGSDEDPVAEDQVKKTAEEPENARPDHRTKSDSSDECIYEEPTHDAVLSGNCSIMESNKLTEEPIITSKESQTVNTKNTFDQALLEELAQYYDNASFADCLEQCFTDPSSCEDSQGVTPGMDDGESKTNAISVTHSLSDWSMQMASTVQVLSARKLYSTTVKLTEMHPENTPGLQESSECAEQANVCCGDSLQDRRSLPIGMDLPDLWGKIHHSTNQSRSDPVIRNVSQCLGPAIQISDPSFHMDYLPCLRHICRLENERHLAKTQRRFHHYLDNAGFGFKQSTIASLTSTYVVSRDQKEI